MNCFARNSRSSESRMPIVQRFSAFLESHAVLSEQTPVQCPSTSDCTSQSSICKTRVSPADQSCSCLFEEKKYIESITVLNLEASRRASGVPERCTSTTDDNVHSVHSYLPSFCDQKRGRRLFVIHLLKIRLSVISDCTSSGPM